LGQKCATKKKKGRTADRKKRRETRVRTKLSKWAHKT